MPPSPAAGSGRTSDSTGRLAGTPGAAGVRPARSSSWRARGASGSTGGFAAPWLAVAVLVVTVAVAGAFAACGGAGAESAEPVATDRVLMPPHYRFDPPAIRVEVGDTVTWVNDDDFTHSVRFEGKEARRVAPGDSVALVFTEPGEHPYDCGLHPHDMSGRVIVGG